MTLEDLKKAGEAPNWLNDEGFKTLSSSYLLPGETPVKMYRRVAGAAAKQLDKPELEDKFFNYIFNGWLCLATPVASNMGTSRGMPISCFSLSLTDSVDGIYKGLHELAMMSKNGGGVAVCASNIRGRGAPISGNGKSEGVVPWLKCFDSTTTAVSQGNVRRGASSVYLRVDHPDIEEFLRIRRPTGDVNRQCLNLNHGVVITDKFMNAVEGGDEKARTLWKDILITRFETGEPYLMFVDTVNRNNPEAYKKNNLLVETSNLCCLVGDELVVTKEGYQPIKNLIGKNVTVYDGKSWIEVDSFKSFGKTTKLIEIKLSDSSVIRVTPNHRIPLTTDEIVTASNLKVGDTIQYHQESLEGSINKQGAYIRGFLVGDGTHTADKPILWLYFTKYMCQERLKKSLSEIPHETIYRSDCNIEPEFVKNTEDRKVMSGLTARRKELLSWATEFKQKLPLEIFNWTFESKVDFISGVLDADGTTTTDADNNTSGIQISSTFQSWLLDFQLLLKSIGVYSTIGLMREESFTDFNDDYGEYKTKNCYRLTVSTTSARKLNHMCKFERLKFEEHLKGRGPYNINPKFSKVVSINSVDTDEEVFCCNVPSTGLFALANGTMTGNSEILLHTDSEHSFVCCLSSLNLAKYDEWKDTDLVETSIWFLDAVMSEFIIKAEKVPGLERAVRFAKKSRALGLGVLGWHTLLQSKMIAFDSLRATNINKIIFKQIKEKADIATRQLADIYGEPEWCKGTGTRNSHTTALAPTVSNSTISGNVSPGIEPIPANAFTKKSAKGSFLQKNVLLEKLLETKGKNDEKTWKTIINDEGSVQSLSFLSDKEKEVFLTARELNQMVLIKQAADRQPFISQGQSLNLFFPADVDPKWFHKIHMEAWKLGLRTLYYCRTGSVLKGDTATRFYSEDCKSCSG
jgi:ribonucleoside-diphosphate reductase alpha chain